MLPLPPETVVLGVLGTSDAPAESFASGPMKMGSATTSEHRASAKGGAASATEQLGRGSQYRVSSSDSSRCAYHH
eukprot:scaffold89935_cov29-Tisochrysis_lutea.AAC.4